LSSGGKVEITGLPSELAQPRNPQIIRVRLPAPPSAQSVMQVRNPI
jgi:hypothetical protein